MADGSSRANRWVAVLVAFGAAVLAFHPLLWLVRSWVAPSYDSMGGWVFLATLLLFLWSVSSPLETTPGRPRRDRALVLLLGSALVRLASRVLAVNVLGAATLIVDVYALGILSGLDHRRRRLSPLWLALAFGFSLPLERMVQRLVGFPLQQISAAGACSLLQAGFEGTGCEGVRILLNGVDVLVDLPCSGARGVLQLLFLFVCLGALLRPGLSATLAGMATVFFSGLAANVVRIALLAMGIGYRVRLFGLNVMDEPWHGLIGLVSLALGATGLYVWSSRIQSRASAASRSPAVSRFRPTLTMALAFSLLSIVIVSLPARPIDVSTPMPPPSLPHYLDGRVATAVPLSSREELYFTLYGGGASRASYGETSLMVITTSSPLRHLHAPDECLTGAGHDVRFLGIDRAGIPSAMYRSEAPDGTAYRVAVTYISDRGEVAESIAEVVWRWFQTPSTWSAVQRIAPWDPASPPPSGFDQAVARAFELEPSVMEERP